MRSINTAIKTLSDWIHWTARPVQEEWATWEEWQRRQSPAHYEQSTVFHNYLKQRAYFQPPQNSCLKGYNPEYYVYCFGDFASLIIAPHSSGDAIDYISLLLDLYDVCKGGLRPIKGDPSGITILRNVVITRSLNPLSNFNFTPYCYPYERIHAHTVAQYSLSTLIMRLIAHYLNQGPLKGQYPSITVGTCKDIFDQRVFGNPIHVSAGLPVVSAPIAITATPKPRQDEIHGYSWPRNRNQFKRDQVPYLRCKICSRIAESLWGEFEACIDCHMKRVCSVCKAPPVVIAGDGLPKCANHKVSSQKLPEPPKPAEPTKVAEVKTEPPMRID